ncbi:MAG: hypothetical protein DME19_05810, partial [Verrucomicrobia bacterium]
MRGQFLILSTRHDERDRVFICLIAGGSAQQVLARGCLCPKEVNSATNSEACAPVCKIKAELRGRGAGSGQDCLDCFAVDVGEAEVAALEA